MTPHRSSPNLTKGVSAILCADWSKEQRKRAVFIADIGARTVSRVGRADWSVAKLLEVAQPWTEQGSVLVTFDAPLGVPASYLKAASRGPLGGGPENFLEFLGRVWSDPGFLDTTVRANEWTVERPFFDVPAGEGTLTSYVQAAGAVGVDLYRAIDRLTKAKSVFIKSGIPGTVGSGACALWKDLGRCLKRDRSFATALLDAPPLLRP